MLTTLRRQAGTVVSAILLLAGCGLTAHSAGAAASEGVSRSELYGTLGAAGVVTFAAFWALLGSHSGRMESAVEKLVEAMRIHQTDPEAHPPAIREKTRPILAKLNSLDAKLDESLRAQAVLIAEHRLLSGLKRQAASSAPRCRATDCPGEDHSAERREAEEGGEE